MYSEKSFKNYIFWIQVKRVVLIILLSCIGAGIGIGIGAVIKGTTGVSDYNNIIIIISTLLLFMLSILVTSGTGKEVQDGYWKIALLRKLTAIQKTLETNNEILAKDDTLKIEAMRKLNKEILGETEELQMAVAKPEKDVKAKPGKIKISKEEKPKKKKVLKKPELIR